MLWRVAMHGGHIHPDFIRDKITDKQLHELAWYFERHPFGHDINHMMMSQMVCSMAGGKPEDYMPSVGSTAATTAEELMPRMPGLGAFMAQNNLEPE